MGNYIFLIRLIIVWCQANKQFSTYWSGNIFKCPEYEHCFWPCSHGIHWGHLLFLLLGSYWTVSQVWCLSSKVCSKYWANKLRNVWPLTLWPVKQTHLFLIGYQSIKFVVCQAKIAYYIELTIIFYIQRSFTLDFWPCDINIIWGHLLLDGFLVY